MLLLLRIRGSWNLHSLFPTGLEFFILLSSMSGIAGFPTQSNYAAANTYQDALARFRMVKGERATSLNLGPINLDSEWTRDSIVETSSTIV